MYALAWMCNRENKLGLRGGILADDMGLGKTLSVISLIMSNYHDGRPLARPRFGQHRTLTKAVAKYLPLKLQSEALTKVESKALEEVGASCNGNAGKPRRKDNRLPVKSSGKPKTLEKQLQVRSFLSQFTMLLKFSCCGNLKN